MTRPADASFASELGASYVGAIFAPGPRQITGAVARNIFDSSDGSARVGVFGTNDVRQIARLAEEAELDVVQLHADPAADDVHAIRSGFGGEIWAALRISGSSLPDSAGELIDAADGVVLDARSPDRLGGTGQPLQWTDLAPEIERVRGTGLIILAGGLTPENVGSAIRALAPDVVDVSSGVETSPGVKDHQRMREFADAVGEMEGSE